MAAQNKDFDPGSELLIHARLSVDGRTVMVAPGVEVKAESVDILTDLPPQAGVVPLVLFFGSDIEREMFAQQLPEFMVHPI